MIKRAIKRVKGIRPYHIALFFVLVLLDQFTKYVVRTNFVLGSSLDLKILAITYVQNTGISFGMFKGYNFIFLLLSVIIMGYFIYIYEENKRFGMQISITCAGITGNLIDRINLGYVVDFIDFRFFPIFNVADSAISIGILWLVFLMWKEEQR